MRGAIILELCEIVLESKAPPQYQRLIYISSQKLLNHHVFVLNTQIIKSLSFLIPHTIHTDDLGIPSRAALGEARCVSIVRYR